MINYVNFALTTLASDKKYDPIVPKYLYLYIDLTYIKRMTCRRFVPFKVNL